MFGYVYKTTSLLNGRIYIGQKIGKFTSKYLGSGSILKLAIKKYGRENFICELIQHAKNKEELNRLEIFYISEARKFLLPEELFNINDGGEGTSPETVRAFWKDEKYRKNMIEKHKGKKGFWKGKKLSVEHARKCGEGHKGIPAWNKGVPMREITKLKLSNPNIHKKISNTVKNLYNSPQYVRKRLEGISKHKSNTEAYLQRCKKISEAKKIYWSDPSNKEAHKVKTTGQKRSIETRLKMSLMKIGKPSPRKGKHHSEATKQILRMKSIGNKNASK